MKYDQGLCAVIIPCYEDKLSKKITLDEVISKSSIITEITTKVNWNINLFLGDSKIFLSDKKPIKVIKVIDITKKKFSKFNIIVGINNSIPPTKGIFFLFEKSWWLSPEKLER